MLEKFPEKKKSENFRCVATMFILFGSKGRYVITVSNSKITHFIKHLWHLCVCNILYITGEKIAGERSNSQFRIQSNTKTDPRLVKNTEKLLNVFDKCNNTA